MQKIFVVAKQHLFFLQNSSASTWAHIFLSTRKKEKMAWHFKRWSSSRPYLQSFLLLCSAQFCSCPSPVLTTKFCHLKGIEQTRGGRMKKPCEGEIISTLSFLWSDPRVGVESLLYSAYQINGWDSGMSCWGLSHMLTWWGHSMAWLKLANHWLRDVQA